MKSAAGLALYQIGTLDDAGTWGTTWSGPHRPGGGQHVFGLGAVTTTTGVANRTPRVFTSAGYLHPQLYFSFTLQEFYDWFDYTGFRDHVRIPYYNAALGGPGSPATESAIGPGPIGLAAAIWRKSPPWHDVIDDTFDGGQTWTRYDSDLVVETLPPVNPGVSSQSSSDPTVGYGGGLMHYLDLSYDIFPDCTPPDPENSMRVVYRRGATASYVAGLGSGSPDLFQIDSTGYHDHPWLAVTEDASGATAHVVYWNVGSGVVKYWKLAPSGAVGPTTIPTAQLPARPPAMVVGAGNTPYAYSQVASFSEQAVAWPTVCRLATVPPPAAECALVGGGATPPPYTTRFRYGDPFPTQQGNCEVGSDGSWYRCTNNATPVSLAADPNTPYKIQPRAAGSRAMHPVQVGNASTLRQRGSWMSRWSMF